MQLKTINPILKIWQNGIDFVIAESEAEAKSFIIKVYGENIDDECLEGEGWSTFEDDAEFTMSHETETPPYVKLSTKTAKEWCQEQGKGYFASSEGF